MTTTVDDTKTAYLWEAEDNEATENEMNGICKSLAFTAGLLTMVLLGIVLWII